MAKTKSSISLNVAESLQCSQKQAKEAVQTTLEQVVGMLENECRVELRNFGVFSVRYREPRTAINPRTGETVQTEGKYFVVFRPGKAMSTRINASRKPQKEEKAAKKAVKKAARKVAKAEKVESVEKKPRGRKKGKKV